MGTWFTSLEINLVSGLLLNQDSFRTGGLMGCRAHSGYFGWMQEGQCRGHPSGAEQDIWNFVSPKPCDRARAGSSLVEQNGWTAPHQGCARRHHR